MFPVPTMTATVPSERGSSTVHTESVSGRAGGTSGGAAATATDEQCGAATYLGPGKLFSKVSYSLQHGGAHGADALLRVGGSDGAAGGGLRECSAEMEPRGGRGGSSRQHTRSQSDGDGPCITSMESQRGGRVDSSFSLPPLLCGQEGWNSIWGMEGGNDEGGRTEEEQAGARCTGGIYNTTHHFLDTDTRSTCTQQHECERWGPFARQIDLLESMGDDAAVATAPAAARDLRSTMEHFCCALPLLPSPPTPLSSGEESDSDIEGGRCQSKKSRFHQSDTRKFYLFNGERCGHGTFTVGFAV